MLTSTRAGTGRLDPCQVVIALALAVVDGEVFRAVRFDDVAEARESLAGERAGRDDAGHGKRVSGMCRLTSL